MSHVYHSTRCHDPFPPFSKPPSGGLWFPSKRGWRASPACPTRRLPRGNIRNFRGEGTDSFAEVMWLRAKYTPRSANSAKSHQENCYLWWTTNPCSRKSLKSCTQPQGELATGNDSGSKIFVHCPRANMKMAAVSVPLPNYSAGLDSATSRKVGGILLGGKHGKTIPDLNDRS